MTPKSDAGTAQVGHDAQTSPTTAPDGSLAGSPTSAVADVANNDAGGVRVVPPSLPALDPNSLDAAVTVASDAAVTGTADAAVVGSADGTAPVAPPTLNAPAWAAQLLGRYAIQSFAFQEVGNVVTRVQEIRLTEISQVGDTLQLTSNLCKHLEVNRTGTLTVVAPAYLAPRRELVAFDGDTFSTTQLDVAVGYDATLPSDCAGKVGQRVPKRAFQTWIKGTDCACVESGPPTSDDCRVLDPEHDQQAGVTNHAAFLTGPADVYAVVDRFSSLVAGVAQSDGRHRGQVLWRERFYQLGCSLTECFDLSDEAKGCATVRNPVQFVPLDRLEQPTLGWTCELVLARVAELFPGAAPATPTSCP